MNDRSDTLELRIGRDELVIRRRYEVASIANDFFIAVLFFTGSILFLFPSAKQSGVWLFILGSFQFLLRPAIRLTRYIHLQRAPSSD